MNKIDRSSTTSSGEWGVRFDLKVLDLTVLVRRVDARSLDRGNQLYPGVDKTSGP